MDRRPFRRRPKGDRNCLRGASNRSDRKGEGGMALSDGEVGGSGKDRADSSGTASSLFQNRDTSTRRDTDKSTETCRNKTLAGGQIIRLDGGIDQPTMRRRAVDANEGEQPTKQEGDQFTTQPPLTEPSPISTAAHLQTPMPVNPPPHAGIATPLVLTLSSPPAATHSSSWESSICSVDDRRPDSGAGRKDELVTPTLVDEDSKSTACSSYGNKHPDNVTEDCDDNDDDDDEEEEEMVSLEQERIRRTASGGSAGGDVVLPGGNTPSSNPGTAAGTAVASLRRTPGANMYSSALPSHCRAAPSSSSLRRTPGATAMHLSAGRGGISTPLAAGHGGGNCIPSSNGEPPTRGGSAFPRDAAPSVLGFGLTLSTPVGMTRSATFPESSGSNGGDRLTDELVLESAMSSSSSSLCGSEGAAEVAAAPTSSKRGSNDRSSQPLRGAQPPQQQMRPPLAGRSSVQNERGSYAYTPASLTLSKNPHLRMDLMGGVNGAFSPNTIRLTESLDNLLQEEEEEYYGKKIGKGGDGSALSMSLGHGDDRHQQQQHVVAVSGAKRRDQSVFRAGGPKKPAATHLSSSSAGAIRGSGSGGSSLNEDWSDKYTFENESDAQHLARNSNSNKQQQPSRQSRNETCSRSAKSEKGVQQPHPQHPHQQHPKPMHQLHPPGGRSGSNRSNDIGSSGCFQRYARGGGGTSSGCGGANSTSDATGTEGNVNDDNEDDDDDDDHLDASPRPLNFNGAFAPPPSQQGSYRRPVPSPLRGPVLDRPSSGTPSQHPSTASSGQQQASSTVNRHGTHSVHQRPTHSTTEVEYSGGGGVGDDGDGAPQQIVIHHHHHYGGQPPPPSPSGQGHRPGPAGHSQFAAVPPTHLGPTPHPLAKDGQQLHQHHGQFPQPVPHQQRHPTQLEYGVATHHHLQFAPLQPQQQLPQINAPLPPPLSASPYMMDHPLASSLGPPRPMTPQDYLHAPGHQQHPHSQPVPLPTHWPVAAQHNPPPPHMEQYYGQREGAGAGAWHQSRSAADNNAGGCGGRWVGPHGPNHPAFRGEFRCQPHQYGMPGGAPTAGTTVDGLHGVVPASPVPPVWSDGTEANNFVPMMGGAGDGFLSNYNFSQQHPMNGDGERHHHLHFSQLSSSQDGKRSQAHLAGPSGYHLQNRSRESSAAGRPSIARGANGSRHQQQRNLSGPPADYVGDSALQYHDSFTGSGGRQQQGSAEGSHNRQHPKQGQLRSDRLQQQPSKPVMARRQRSGELLNTGFQKSPPKGKRSNSEQRRADSGASAAGPSQSVSPKKKSNSPKKKKSQTRASQQQPQRPNTPGASDANRTKSRSGGVGKEGTSPKEAAADPKRAELVESPATRLAFKEFYRRFRAKERSSFQEAQEFALQCIAPQSPQPADSHNGEPTKAMVQEKDGRESVPTLPETIHWRVYLELADLAKRSNNFSKARRLYGLVCTLQPYASQGWLEYSKLEEECGNPELCSCILRSGLEYCSLSESLLARAIRHEEKEGQLGRARGLLARLKHVGIERVWRTVLEGALLEARAGNDVMARRVLAYLMHHVPWYGPLYSEAFRLEGSLGRPKEALAVVERGLAEIPRYGPLWFGAFRLCEGLDLEGRAYDLPKTMVMVRRAVGCISRELVWKVHLDAAQIQERAALQAVADNPDRRLEDELAPSRHSFAKAILTCPANLRWKVWLAGGRMELVAGRTNEARRLFLQAYSVVPEKGWTAALLECARLEEFVGDTELARAILCKARYGTGVSDWKVWLESVLVEVRAGERQRAVCLAQNAVEAHSGTGRLWAALVQLRYWDGVVSQLSSLKHALGAVPKSGEVWCEGARLLLNPFLPTFDLERARQHLTYATRFTPQYGDSFVETLRLELVVNQVLPIANRFVGRLKDRLEAGDESVDGVIRDCVREAALIISSASQKMYEAEVESGPEKTTHADRAVPWSLLRSLNNSADAVDTSKLALRCSNADPNYGLLWFFCRHRPTDTARTVLSRAKEIIASDIRQYAHLYAGAIIRRAGVSIGLQKEWRISSANKPSSAPVSGSNNNAVVLESSAEWDSQLESRLHLSPSLDVLLFGGNEDGTTNDDVGMVLLENITSGSDFVTGIAALNRHEPLSRMSLVQRRKVLFGSDSLLS